MPTYATHTTYDAVPYQGGIVGGTHPEHLAVIARLFALESAPAESCRVLEIGCASATNLLPMAYALPNSTFVGIDPSERQIAMGIAACADYGASNVELLACDVRDTLTWDREFDYIICHGVFSWVNTEVQDAILECARRLLAPTGIAYISYNTLPGFHTRAPIREMMRFHGSGFSDPTERAQQARALLAFLAQATSKLSGDAGIRAYNTFLAEESSLLKTSPDSYVLHEHFAEHNEPFYFHEFVERADTHGLQYLGDAAFHTMMLSGLPQEIANDINAISSSQIAVEQYRDFVVNRMFRKTLLCRKEAELVRNISTEAIASLSFREGTVRKDDDWKLSKVGGVTVRVTDVNVIRVLDAIAAAAPLALSFQELLVSVNSGGEAMQTPQLAAILLSLYALDAVEFRTWTPPMSHTITERPAAFLPARRSATAKRPATPLPLHAVVELDPFVRAVLPMVDGTKNANELCDAVEAGIADGSFVVDAVDPGDLPKRSDIERLVAESLEYLRTCGLLILERQ